MESTTLQNKGKYCHVCNTYIPVISNFNDSLKHEIIQLINNGNRITAVKQLMAKTKCSHRSAKIWVSHSGIPSTETPNPLCPYCGGRLRSAKATLNNTFNNRSLHSLDGSYAAAR